MIWYVAVGSALGGIQSVIPTIDEMMGGGLITLEKANVIIYRPENKG